jgi:hypothetical protein
MHPELQRLRALAAVMATAEATLNMACRTLRESAAALLRGGDAALAEVGEATGLNQGEVLDLFSRHSPGRERSWKQPGIAGLS